MFVVYARHASICAQLPACSETKLDGKHENPRKYVGPAVWCRNSATWTSFHPKGTHWPRLSRQPTANCRPLDDRFDFFPIACHAIHYMRHIAHTHTNIIPTWIGREANTRKLFLQRHWVLDIVSKPLPPPTLSSTFRRNNNIPAVKKIRN